MLTRQEKEKLVIDLYNQGKTIRDIAKELRISFRDIGAILKQEEKHDIKESLSPSTQAYRLFSEGKAPVDVAIALDLSESDTARFYEEYLNLEQMNELRLVYDQIGPDIIHFLKLYKLSKDAHMSPEHVVNLLQISNEYLPLLEQKCKKLRKDIDLLESEKQNLGVLGNQVSVLSQISCKYEKEIKNLQNKKIRLETLMNNGRYEKVRQIVEGEVNNSLSKRRDLLKLAVASVLESLSQFPDKYNFLIDSNRSCGGQYAVSHPYIDAYRTLILDEAQKLFELMARDLTSGIVNGPTLTVHPKTNAK